MVTSDNLAIECTLDWHRVHSSSLDKKMPYRDALNTYLLLVTVLVIGLYIHLLHCYIVAILCLDDHVTY